MQYFQRARMEWFPQQAGTPYEVQLTLLGDALTADRRPFPTATPPEGPRPRTRATSPRCATPCGGPFLRYFETQEGLTRLGFPISEELQESNEDGSGRTYRVQYFQRARLEYHPEQAGTPYEMQLGLLGEQALRQRGWLS